MYRNILLCYDGSKEGRNALKEGAEIALCMQVQTHLLAVIREDGGPGVLEGYSEAWFRSQDSAAQNILDEGVAWLRERGLDAHGRIVFGNAIEEIVRAAQETKADLIVVGHRRRSRLARWWSDDEDAVLLDLIPCSVLVAIEKPEGD